MFSTASRTRLCHQILASLILGSVATMVAAESSTGIRLGTTDFGGKQTSRLGTFSDPSPTGSSYRRHHGSNDGYHGDSSSHDRHHDRHYRTQPNYGGIQGHPSYGLSTSPYYRHRHHSGYPNAYLYYRSPSVGVQVYAAPQIYSSGYEHYSPSGGVINSASSRQPELESAPGINPWTALGEYQFNTARYAFEAQAQQQPHASLPRVGLALSTALAGNLEAGAFAMEDALLSDTSDLRYFHADPELQLILEELLLSYERDPMMTASLHYLNRDYDAAQRALEVAGNYCQQCTSVDKLQSLINTAL